jgi:hypothetical protein
VGLFGALRFFHGFFRSPDIMPLARLGNHSGKNQILILQDPKLGPRLPKRKAILGAMNLAGILLRIGRALDFRSLGGLKTKKRWTEWTDLGSWAKGEISKFHDFMNIHF